MMTRSNLTEQQIASIADVLANCHDWDSSNLIEDLENVLNLNAESLSELFTEFLNLDPQVRLAPEFDHRKFILKFQLENGNC